MEYDLAAHAIVHHRDGLSCFLLSVSLPFYLKKLVLLEPWLLQGSCGLWSSSWIVFYVNTGSGLVLELVLVLGLYCY